MWSRLRRGREVRTRFVESNLSKNLAFQLRSLRDREDWSQEQLAEQVGMNQNAISRLENPFYGKATLTTLKRLAQAFDVALIVRFVPFGELVDWVSSTPRVNTGLSTEALNVPSFEAEIKSLAEVGEIPRIGEISQPKLESYHDKAPTATQYVFGWNVRSMDEAIRLRDKKVGLSQSTAGKLGTTASDIKIQNVAGGLQ